MKKGDVYFRGRLCGPPENEFCGCREKRRKRRNKEKNEQVNKIDSEIGQNREKEALW